jgi:hypothetical protein
LASLEVDHVVARQHDGSDDEMNLAVSCKHCNRRKGTNLAGIDPQTGWVVALFDPRRQVWGEHLRWRGAVVEGVTSVGRATVSVLNLNAIDRVALRDAATRGVVDLQ